MNRIQFTRLFKRCSITAAIGLMFISSRAESAPPEATRCDKIMSKYVQSRLTSGSSDRTKTIRLIRLNQLNRRDANNIDVLHQIRLSFTGFRKEGGAEIADDREKLIKMAQRLMRPARFPVGDPPLASSGALPWTPQQKRNYASMNYQIQRDLQDAFAADAEYNAALEANDQADQAVRAEGVDVGEIPRLVRARRKTAEDILEKQQALSHRLQELRDDFIARQMELTRVRTAAVIAEVSHGASSFLARSCARSVIGHGAGHWAAEFQREVLKAHESNGGLAPHQSVFQPRAAAAAAAAAPPARQESVWSEGDDESIDWDYDSDDDEAGEAADDEGPGQPAQAAPPPRRLQSVRHAPPRPPSPAGQP